MFGTVRQKISEYYQTLTPGQKRAAVWSSILVMALLIGFFSPGLNKTTKTLPAAKTSKESEGKEKVLSVDSSLLEKTQYAELKKTNRELQSGYKSLEKDIEDIKKLQQVKSQPIATTTNSFPPSPLPQPENRDRVLNQAPRPDSSYPVAQMPQPGNSVNAQLKAPTDGIKIVSFQVKEDLVNHGKTPDKKKETENGEESVYLPPGVMKATLLSGLAAPTMEVAKKNPMPVFIRIQDLAILPNRVKADLRGCFFIANGWGDLASEKVYLPITTLSCISKDGNSVIDQSVTGAVWDGDGSLGLRGTVVARFDKAMWAATLTGVFKGVGDVLKASSQVTTLTGTGATQMFNTEQLGKAAVGGGLGGAFDKMHEFYMRLAEMSMPVVEVGATKIVTVGITEGVVLKIKKKPRVI